MLMSMLLRHRALSAFRLKSCRSHVLGISLEDHLLNTKMGIPFKQLFDLLMEASLFIQCPLCAGGGTRGSDLQGRGRGPVSAVQPPGHSDSQLTLFTASGGREPLGRILEVKLCGRRAPRRCQAVMCERVACLLGLCWQKRPLVEV